MILYVTFGDQPSGIFRSQVMDFVNFLNKNKLGCTRLVAFISIRGYSLNRKKIKTIIPDAIVIPMYPRMANWKINRIVLHAVCRYFRPTIIYGRGVLATQLALSAKRKKLVSKVIYDGRGAISAEWHEYNVVQDKTLKKTIRSLEDEVVRNSDMRIAVSTKLVEFWRSEFNYQPGAEYVVPCTLDESYERITINSGKIFELRSKEGLPQNAIILVFSGSMAGWQSVELLASLIEKLLVQPEIATLFLSPDSPTIEELKNKYPGRVFSKFVAPDAVPVLLQACDYGLLVRENSVTNKVASPVKFAEYLACGLKVIISDNIGDYSQIVIDERLGFLAGELPAKLEPVSQEERFSNNKFATEIYSKKRYKEVYEALNTLD